ncbi:MAG: TonB-dependent receptor, partial [Methylococcales bacterium]|nr:TonB-dependent receptor [Methylococcales bacterium]
ISEGFFSNIGKTRRYGIEAGFNASVSRLFSEIDDWHFSTNYTYLNARFLDGFTIQNPLDLEGDEGLNVKKGNRMPGLPEHIYKASIGVNLWKRWSLGFDAQFSGNQYFRGDEANSTAPLGGYWLFNAKTEIKINDYVSLYGKIDNIFDRKYKSFGVYGDPSEVLGDSFDNGRFVSPGMPRAGWVGIRLTL